MKNKQNIILGLFIMIITICNVSCTHHVTKYKNGNVDKYTYQDDLLVITVQNGDGSDGELAMRITKDNVKAFDKTDYCRKWCKSNRGKTTIDCIVRTIKWNLIDVKYQLNYPATMCFNKGNIGSLLIDPDNVNNFFIDCPILCKNGFNVQMKVTMTICPLKDSKFSDELQVYLRG